MALDPSNGSNFEQLAFNRLKWNSFSKACVVWCQEASDGSDDVAESLQSRGSDRSQVLRLAVHRQLQQQR